MRDLIKTLVLLALVYNLTHVLGSTAHTVATSSNHVVAVVKPEIPVQFDKGGSDKGYVHGDHCMDARVF